MKSPLCLTLALLALDATLAVPSRHARQLDLENYESANYDVDPSWNGEDLVYDYGDGFGSDETEIEIGTVASQLETPQSPAASLEEDEFLPLRPQTIEQSLEGSGAPLGPGPHGGSSTCILCTCLRGSVYCDDIRLQSIPPLPKETTHFYCRYNHITRIHKSDFANMNMLKRIDLTGNEISEIDNDTFMGLRALEELVLRHNQLTKIPTLPPSMILIDASHNHLGSKSLPNEAFKEMPNLRYVYLADNRIDYIPVPLPESLQSLHLQNNNIQMLHEDTFCKTRDINYIRHALEDIRLDGNPVNLNKTPLAYICLPRIPIGGLL